MVSAGESARENGLEGQKQIERRIKLHNERLRHILVPNSRVGNIRVIHLFENVKLYFRSKFCGEEALDNIQVRHVEVLWDCIDWITYETLDRLRLLMPVIVLCVP
jgi:hypothetical protein